MSLLSLCVSVCSYQPNKRLQRPLVPRSRFRQRLRCGVSQLPIGEDAIFRNLIRSLLSTDMKVVLKTDNGSVSLWRKDRKP